MLTAHLVKRTEEITIRLVKEHALRVAGGDLRRAITDDRPGWQMIDAVLITGGSSRMPMIRKMLQRISGTTLNTSLSPDQSICHGASYYAGMLLSNAGFAQSLLSNDARDRLAKVRQRSVNARALGVLVRDPLSGKRIPHYMLPANTPLPCEFREVYGTIVPNQKRVQVHIVESGTSDDDDPIELGACVIQQLPADLPAASLIEVTIRYDAEARVHVSARDVTSGQVATAEIVRPENLVKTPEPQASEVTLVDAGRQSGARVSTAGAKPSQLQSTSIVPCAPKTVQPKQTAGSRRLATSDRPLPLCNACGELLNARGLCPHCGANPPAPQRKRRPVVPAGGQKAGKVPTPGDSVVKTRRQGQPPAGPAGRPAVVSGPVPPLHDEDVLELTPPKPRTPAKGIPVPPQTPAVPVPQVRPAAKRRRKRPTSDPLAAGEDEFWDIVQ